MAQEIVHRPVDHEITDAKEATSVARIVTFSHVYDVYEELGKYVMLTLMRCGGSRNPRRRESASRQCYSDN